MLESGNDFEAESFKALGLSVLDPLRDYRPLSCVGLARIAETTAARRDRISRQRVRDRNGNVLRVTLTRDQKYRIWTPLRRYLAGVDRRDGPLRRQIFRATSGASIRCRSCVPPGTSRDSGHARAGASTITMQLARLRFHLHTRTLGRKIRQILRALELERHYSKNEILEAYLNLAPYGRNIEGAGAASEIYFGKTRCALDRTRSDRAECDPAKPDSPRARWSVDENAVLIAAQTRCPIACGNAERRNLAGAVSRGSAMPRAELSAPHFVQGVLAEQNGDAPEINTTLDLRLQQISGAAHHRLHRAESRSAESKTPRRC